MLLTEDKRNDHSAECEKNQKNNNKQGNQKKSNRFDFLFVFFVFQGVPPVSCRESDWTNSTAKFF